MLLAEDVLLLVTDEVTGKNHAQYADLILAGGLLCELSLAGNVRVTEHGESIRKNRAVAVPDAPWPTDQLLADAMTLTQGKPQWRPPDLAERLSKNLVGIVYQRLARAEVVSRQQHRVLGVFPATRWTVLDRRRRDELLVGLDEVFLFGAAPDPRTAALIALLSAGGMIARVVDRGRGLDRRTLNRRAKVLQRQYWPALATAHAIQARDGAVGV